MVDFRRLFQFGKKSLTSDEIVRRILYGGEPVSSGVDVTVDTAIQVSAVLACTRTIANAVSTLPFKIYRRKNSVISRAENHPLHPIFDVAANDFMDTTQFRETMAFHWALTGNAYAYISRVNGEIAELIPIEPSRVSVKQNDDLSLTYTVSRNDGRSMDYPQSSIWHWRGTSWNGYQGLSMVKTGREAIGLSIALERSHSRLHKNGVRASGAWTVDGTLTDKQQKELRSYISNEVAGVDNTGTPIILDRAMKFVSLAMNGVDAQHLETRRFQIEEICRFFFGVMPIGIGSSDKASTFASAEQMFLAELTHAIRPVLRKFEASVNFQLIGRAGMSKGYYSGFVDEEFLRGDSKARAEYYASAIQNGWMEPDEIRALQELNALPGGSGLRMQSNMILATMLGQNKPTTVPDSQITPSDGGQNGSN